MASIKIMDELLANKIAAGEVVERCASVVKELVENSIDAKSTEIKVELVDAGTKEIKVTDNGIGMDQEDALLAFGRHATSKLKSEEDLYRIETLGFRGEALASIASVSDITLKTSTGEVGMLVEIHGGRIVTTGPTDARKGTIMSVRNLFYNTPARLKHMKSLYTELACITDYMNKLALTRPDICFYLSNNGSVLLNTDGSNLLLKTISSIFGLEIVKKMIEVHTEDDDYIIDGYISLPEIHRSNRNQMITIVNGRIVKNIELNRVINDAYHSFKPDNRYPVVVLNIEVDPSLIDVNIHPTKMDIKFSKMEELCQLITDMIKKVLYQKNLIPVIEEAPVIPKKVYQEFQLDFNEPNKIEKSLIVNEEYQVSMVKEEELVYEKKEENRFPELYPVGLVHGTYIVCQNDIGIYLIDQHAAKERINYEFYKKKLGSPSQDSIGLLFPFTIELSNSEFILLKQHFDLLRQLNFEIDEFGIHSIIIKRHPTWLPKNYEEQATRKIIEVVLVQEKKFSIEKFNESIATMLSCKLAIKANENITLEEMEQLLKDLKKCDNPFHCPHGRPVMITYTKSELEKLFKRSGF